MTRQKTKSRVGKTYGDWTVIAPTDLRTADRRVVWMCRCVCGTERAIGGSVLNKRDSTNCGCRREMRASEREAQDRSARAARELVRLDAPLTKEIKEYKKGARRRNLPWALSRSETIALFLAPCGYCGAPPERAIWNVGRTVRRLVSGIDRKDNTRGYEPGNCLSCCTFCNIAKAAYSSEFFLAKAAQIASFQTRRLTQEQSLTLGAA